jgi:hypothetical protein
MTNAEIINEVNGLLQRALGLLATIENEPHAEQAHSEEAHAEEAHAEEEIEDEQNVPAPAAQAVAEATVHAAEAEATVVVEQT